MELTSENAGTGQITTMSRIASGHHVLGIKHLLGEFSNGQGAILLTTLGSKRSKSGHKEVQTWEGHHIDGQFTQIGIQLTGETQTGGDTGHGNLF